MNTSPLTLGLPPGADPEQEWQAALCAWLPVARKFVRAWPRRSSSGRPRMLMALRGLPALLEARPTKRVPTGFLDARLADVEVVPAGWRRQVFTDGRPPGTVDRAGYTFCVLSQFHTRLKRRDIFAAASSRWADPRAQLLDGEEWQAKREILLESLDLPEGPDELLEECAAELDGAWRHMAGRAAAAEVTVGADGRLHAAALRAVAEPDTLAALRERCQQMMPRVDIRRCPQLGGGTRAGAAGQVRYRGKALACPVQLSGGESQDAYISLTTNEPARARRLWPWRRPP